MVVLGDGHDGETAPPDPTRPDPRGGKRQLVGEEPIQLPEPGSEVRTQIGLHEFGCLSVSHQNNVPWAMLSDTSFLGLLTTLVSRKHLPVPQSDETVCVEGSLECAVVYHKTDEPYYCGTVFSF